MIMELKTSISVDGEYLLILDKHCREHSPDLPSGEAAEIVRRIETQPSLLALCEELFNLIDPTKENSIVIVSGIPGHGIAIRYGLYEDVVAAIARGKGTDAK